MNLISLLTLSLSCMSTKNAAAQSDKLNGTWLPVQQEMNGTVLPEAGFENQKLIISDSTYIVSAESIDKGIVKYRDGKMDISSTDGVNTGKHFMAIYKYENEQLTICYNLLGDGYPVAFETKGKRLQFLSVFKKKMIK